MGDPVRMFPSDKPRLSAMIKFVLPDRLNPLVEAGVQGDDYHQLALDADKQVQNVLEIRVKHGLVHKHVTYTGVMVCGTLPVPNRPEYCLPTTFSGKIEEIIEQAQPMLHDLFKELDLKHSDPIRRTLLEQSLSMAQSESIANVMRRVRSGRG